MGSLMYKQRPVYAAIAGAICTLVLGFCSSFWLHRQVDAGLYNPSAILFIAFTTCGITGMFLIFAFARYQFTHLWKNPDPAFSKKAKKGHRHGARGGDE